MIRVHPITGVTWIEKHGVFIGNAASTEDAKRILNELLD